VTGENQQRMPGSQPELNLNPNEIDARLNHTERIGGPQKSRLITLAIALFLISMTFLIFVSWMKKIPLLSPYGIFVAFQFLYNFAPWVTAFLGLDTVIFPLLGDLRLAERQLYLSASANLCFGACFLGFYRRVRLQPVATDPSDAGRRKRFFLALFPLFILSAVLGHFYGWNTITALTMDTDGSVAGGMFTVTAYVKYFFVGGYLYYLYKFGFDKWAGLLLLEHTIVMLVDGARTTYLPIALFSLIVVGDNAKNEARRGRLYLIAFVGVLLSLVTRALILTGDTSVLAKIFAPVMIEGTMGAYCSLQSLSAISQAGHPSYTFGLSYVVDPFVWFVPTGPIRDSLSFFQHWVDSISSVLGEPYSHMGGFYYGAEATAAFSYAGPAIVTSVYAIFLVWIERNKNTLRMLYVAAIPTLGILFVKTIFGNLVKMFFIQFGFVLCFVVAAKLWAVLERQNIASDAESISPEGNLL